GFGPVVRSTFFTREEPRTVAFFDEIEVEELAQLVGVPPHDEIDRGRAGADHFAGDGIAEVRVGRGPELGAWRLREDVRRDAAPVVAPTLIGALEHLAGRRVANVPPGTF